MQEGLTPSPFGFHSETANIPGHSAVLEKLCPRALRCPRIILAVTWDRLVPGTHCLLFLSPLLSLKWGQPRFIPSRLPSRPHAFTFLNIENTENMLWPKAPAESGDIITALQQKRHSCSVHIFPCRAWCDMGTLRGCPLSVSSQG